MRQINHDMILGMEIGLILAIILGGSVGFIAKRYEKAKMVDRAVEAGVAAKDRSGRIIWTNPDFYYVLTGEPKNVISSGSYMSEGDQPR